MLLFGSNPFAFIITLKPGLDDPQVGLTCTTGWAKTLVLDNNRIIPNNFTSQNIKFLVRKGLLKRWSLTKHK